jgi:hypothetical protein
VPYKQDPYVSTSVTKGLWEGQLTWLLLYQNYRALTPRVAAQTSVCL